MRLAVVGSGTGGTFAANLLASKLQGEISQGRIAVDLIGESKMHVFQPANLEVAFKGSSPDKFTKREEDLLRSGVAFTSDPASRIDLANRTIALRSGEKRGYDYLVMATGTVASPESIPGLAESSLNFHTGPGNARRIWEALQEFKGGRILVAIAGIPHKCPPSPNEALFMLDEYFRRRGIREQVDLKLLTPYPRVYPASKIADVIEPIFKERGVEVAPFFNIDYVDPQLSKVYSLEGEAFEYDLLLTIPPHHGADVIRDSGIGDAEGWIPTDRKTLNVQGYDDAFAIGDATNIPISKSGVVAHLESNVVARNIISEIHGDSELYQYNGRINCPMEVGGRRAIFVSATYESPPKDQTPSMLKCLMKKGFGNLYWSALKGTWEWMFGLYFGETSSHLEAPVQR